MAVFKKKEMILVLLTWFAKYFLTTLGSNKANDAIISSTYLPPLKALWSLKMIKEECTEITNPSTKKELKSISNLSTNVLVITEEVMRIIADTCQVTSLQRIREKASMARIPQLCVRTALIAA